MKEYTFGKLRRLKFKNNSFEIWRKIIFDGKDTVYEVSNLGRVRHVINRNIKKPHARTDGYVYVQLHIGGKIKKINVHRLVAKAFIPNPYNKEEVNHIDGVKTNNVYTNLEWVTHSENLQHALNTGLLKAKTDFDAKHNTYSQNEILEVISYLKQNQSASEISKRTEVDISTIRLIRTGFRFRDFCIQNGYTPEDPEKGFDFTPYDKEVIRLIKENKSLKNILKTIAIDGVTKRSFTYHIRKLKENLLKSSS